MRNFFSKMFNRQSKSSLVPKPNFDLEGFIRTGEGYRALAFFEKDDEEKGDHKKRIQSLLMIEEHAHDIKKIAARALFNALLVQATKEKVNTPIWMEVKESKSESKINECYAVVKKILELAPDEDTRRRFIDSMKDELKDQKNNKLYESIVKETERMIEEGSLLERKLPSPR